LYGAVSVLFLPRAFFDLYFGEQNSTLLAAKMVFIRQLHLRRLWDFWLSSSTLFLLALSSEVWSFFPFYVFSFNDEMAKIL
jgi:hypothetical protein